MSRGRQKIYAVVLVVAVAAGFAVYRWWHERPPYGAEGLGFAATAELLPSDKRPEDEYHGVRFLARERSVAVGGRLTWRPAPGSSADWQDDGRFMIFVVDKRVQLMPPQIWGASPSGIEVLSGGDGVQERVAEEYPWLRGVGSIKLYDNVSRSGGSCLSTAPAAGEVAFVAVFPPIPEGDPERRFLAAAPIAVSDIMVAVAFIGPDRQVYWAERVFG
ncbi:hypothetical protein [Catellatospora sichuanensis]|uniref:hypothetical protein n=1 Tax=Catellatospora sichuanensis TaxID=1969805 RepID=UPI001642E3D8|nr:hypothetical protein [Catellatospora sichuanensis]